MKTQKEIANNERATWNNNSNKKWFSEEEIRKAISKHEFVLELTTNIVIVDQLLEELFGEK